MTSKQALPPESFIYTGKSKEKTTITHIQYDTEGIRELRTTEVHPKLNDWIIIQGLEDVDFISKMCNRFGVDPLVTEDILNVHQRNKLEIYEEYLFSVKKFAFLQGSDIHHEYISILLFEDKLITFQERKTPFFDSIVDRIKNKIGIITEMGHDYLYYTILDHIVDHNIEVRKFISEKIMLLEDDIIELENTNQQDLYYLRKELMFLKNSNKQMSFSFREEEYKKTDLIKQNIYKYFVDLKDHVVRLDENVDIERELLSNLLDVHINNVSNRMNHIMTVLTVFSAIFIPLSFLSGVFGMNFVEFGFLQNPYGIYYFILICLLIIGIMLTIFIKNKWLK